MAEDAGPRPVAVLEVVYLVFNEGYAATAGQGLVPARAMPGGQIDRRDPDSAGSQ